MVSSTSRILEPLDIPPGKDAAAVFPQLREALDGKRTFLPLPTQDPSRRQLLLDTMRPGAPISEEITLVMATSGSTGTPKGAQLSAQALRASAEATETLLGGPGQWLLALPAHHIAGIQVIMRSLAAGWDPVIMPSGPFSPAAFASEIGKLSAPRKYCSLVPTQVEQLLLEPQFSEAVAGLDAILVGGAPLSPMTRQQCEDRGWRIMQTYGSSETAGGMVYDGTVFPGSRIAIIPMDSNSGTTPGCGSPEVSPEDFVPGSQLFKEGEAGRVWLGGPTVASGYRNSSHPAFSVPGWFRTDDIGYIQGGTLTIIGRYDQAINTGGMKVLPEVVESAARSAGLPGCAVIGVPSDKWGEAVCVVLEGESRGDSHVVVVGEDELEQIRSTLRPHLPAYALPTVCALVDSLPLRGPGKVDRTTLTAWVENAQSRQ